MTVPAKVRHRFCVSGLFFVHISHHLLIGADRTSFSRIGDRSFAVLQWRSWLKRKLPQHSGFQLNLREGLNADGFSTPGQLCLIVIALNIAKYLQLLLS
jgi:hypothetical protein